jgi:predicted enzyme related to lactoylglutathione lyase
MSRVVHFEIHATEPERAIEFYRGIFGWEFTSFVGPAEYWLIKTGPAEEPGIDGGLIRRRGEIDGQAVIAYVCTIDVESLDETLAAVIGRGGTLALPRMPIPGVGWLAYAKDTEGNIFGMMQSDPRAS